VAVAVNHALFAAGCERLAEWALIGPVQRAAVESFAEALLQRATPASAPPAGEPVNVDGPAELAPQPAPGLSFDAQGVLRPAADVGRVHNAERDESLGQAPPQGTTDASATNRVDHGGCPSDWPALIQRMYAEAAECDLYGITKPAALLREAAEALQHAANMQAMEEFAEAVTAAHFRGPRPLTLDQIGALEAGCGHGTLHWDTRVSLVRATERAHGIGHPELPLLSVVEKSARVHALVNDGDYPGMSEAFDAHMGAACWVDPAYRQDAATWAAAWKCALRTTTAGDPPAPAAAREVVEALRRSLQVAVDSDLGRLWVWPLSAREQWMKDVRAALAAADAQRAQEGGE